MGLVGSCAVGPTLSKLTHIFIFFQISKKCANLPAGGLQYSSNPKRCGPAEVVYKEVSVIHLQNDLAFNSRAGPVFPVLSSIEQLEDR